MTAAAGAGWAASVAALVRLRARLAALLDLSGDDLDALSVVEPTRARTRPLVASASR
jgi:hypothetical protein